MKPRLGSEQGELYACSRGIEPKGRRNPVKKVWYIETDGGRGWMLAGVSFFTVLLWLVMYSWRVHGAILITRAEGTQETQYA